MTLYYEMLHNCRAATLMSDGRSSDPAREYLCADSKRWTQWVDAGLRHHHHRHRLHGHRWSGNTAGQRPKKGVSSTAARHMTRANSVLHGAPRPKV